MGRVVRLHVVHQNRLFRECLVATLADPQRLQVVAVSASDDECKASVDRLRPDVVLVDLNLSPEFTIDLTKHVCSNTDSAKVILLVASNTQESVFECIAAGAHGCVLEESSVDELKSAIDRVLAGEKFCSPQIVQSLFTRLSNLERQGAWRDQAETVALSARELEVLELVSDGLSNKQIARELSLSLYTVKNHVHNILEKLQVEDRHKAAEHARFRSLITPARAFETRSTNS